MSIKTFLFLFVISFLASCTAVTKDNALPQTDCIYRVMAVDDSLGKIRNRECETLPLSQTIVNYTKAMQQIETKDCPDAFLKAYSSHKEAWNAMLPITDNYPKLRGEMHVLFKQLEQSPDSVAFKKQQAAIWTTWAAVEPFFKK